MVKQRKKRNKVYSGSDAANTKPVITRISAVNRTRLGQWWFDRKKFLRPILIAAAVIIVVVWLIIELLRVTTGL